MNQGRREKAEGRRDRAKQGSKDQGMSVRIKNCLFFSLVRSSLFSPAASLLEWASAHSRPKPLTGSKEGVKYPALRMIIIFQGERP